MMSYSAKTKKAVLDSEDSKTADYTSYLDDVTE